MASSQALPEPMNASPHHSKVKITTTLADPTFVAGTFVSGKMEMECRADKGLGIGIMMVELFAIQELTSRDHSANSTFIHSRRLFQGPGLPPSNAVQAHPSPGDPPLPANYYTARRGKSTFLFRIPIPASSPSSLVFGNGLARVRYELRASVGVFWKGEKKLVVDSHRDRNAEGVDVVEAYPYDVDVGKVPEGIVVAEGGKLWMQGRMVGSVVVAGGSACLELQVKNHSSRKNTGLTLSLTRTLYLPASSTNTSQPAPVQISDTLTTVPYRGAEYVIPPGAEGVANLVFDVPKWARGVRGGTLDGEESEGGGGGPRHSESLFEIRCKVEVKLSMGMGSKDVVLEIPVDVVHPRAMPAVSPNEQPASPYAQQAVPYPTAEMPYNMNPYYHPQQPHMHGATSPVPFAHMPYIDPTHNQVWLPPPPPPISMSHTGAPGYPYMPPLSPVPQEMYAQPYAGYNQQQQQLIYAPTSPGPGPYYIQRPLSAGPVVSGLGLSLGAGIPPPVPPPPGLPLHTSSHPLPIPPQPPISQQDPYQQSQDFQAEQGVLEIEQPPLVPAMQPEAEEGKGQRALRVSQHLRMSSRHRSVSPRSHRWPIPVGGAPPVPPLPSQALQQQQPGGLSSSRPARTLPAVPPGAPLLLPQAALQTDTEAVVMHSPRPQLTPKHSYTSLNINSNLNPNAIDPHSPNQQQQKHLLIPKSERVEELEKMAEAVVRRSGDDLSCDLPRGVVEGVEREAEARAEAKEGDKDVDLNINVNKTLPGPPVPSGKVLSSPIASRARADVYFAVTAGGGPSPGTAAENTPKMTTKTPTMITKTPTMLLVETSPLPSDQTPPTPALHAVLPHRERHERNELKTESGLDALERRLLAEVGTRKVDPWWQVGGSSSSDKESPAGTNMKMRAPMDPRARPDSRNVLSPLASSAEPPRLNINTQSKSPNADVLAGISTSIPIPIPVKSPEPLNDSAISSLTLAGGLGGEEGYYSDGEGDGRTHRAGVGAGGSGGSGAEGSGSGSADEGADGNGRTNGRTNGRSNGNGTGVGSAGLHLHMHMHMRERAEAVGTPTKMSRKEKDSGKEKEKEGLGKLSGRKKDKSAAKGRVAAWLGRIDPDIPPQEQVIPPSPSVFRPPGGFEDEHEGNDENVAGVVSHPSPAPHSPREEPEPEIQNGSIITAAAPNPRSSGFVPIATLNRNTIQARPLIARDATVVEEARRVQDLWSSHALPPPGLQDRATPAAPQAMRFPLTLSTTAAPQSIRTDRRVSPPSARPVPAGSKTPLSYSAAARNVWRQADQSAKTQPLPTVPPLASTSTPTSEQNIKPPSLPHKVLPSGGGGRLQYFPPNTSVDPEVKYDIRSARGGRGGKVTSVASLWASGAIMNNTPRDGPKGKEVPRLVNTKIVEEPESIPAPATTPTPSKPQPPERKSFSAAVKTPPKKAFKSALIAPPGGVGGSPSKPVEAQRRPDSRNLFSAGPAAPIQGPKKGTPSTAFMNSGGQKSFVPATRSAGNRSTEALVQKPRPATAMSRPYSVQGKATSTHANLSTPAAVAPSSEAKLHEFAAKGVKPVIKATYDPAVVSSSHAVPHLSSTASLARPQMSSASSAAALAQKKASSTASSSSSSRPGVVVKLPPALSASTVLSSAVPSEVPRSVSPSKPADLAFGQARLRDLIKKYQGQGQKT